jgi:hypothetical protein
LPSTCGFRIDRLRKRLRRRYVACESSAEHRGTSSIDPIESSFADFIRGQDAALCYPLFERLQVGFENAFDRADTPYFGLCAHIDVLLKWGLADWFWGDFSRFLMSQRVLTMDPAEIKEARELGQRRRRLGGQETLKKY